MIRLILCGLLAIILPVQPYRTLIEEGTPFTYICDQPSAVLHRPGIGSLAYCQDCPSLPCTVREGFEEQILAYCNETNPIIHTNSTPLMDGVIRCPANVADGVALRVGRYDGRLHTEDNSPVALAQRDFTLVCDKRQDGYVHWYNEHGKTLVIFFADCTQPLPHDDSKMLDVTCDRETTKLHLKNVSLSDDGKIYACSEGYKGVPSLFRLTVNVPVTSVYIQPQSQDLVVHEEASFICIVEESYPEASFGWVIAYQNGTSLEIHQESTTISKNLKGNVWQTTSTLRLNMMRDYHEIMCRATIGNLPWTNSEYQALDIKVPVTSVYIQPQNQVLVEHEDAIFVCTVEESNPKASFQWVIMYPNGSSQEIHQDSTTISKTLNGKLWQTKSILMLNMMRDYQQIMCKATTENMPWTNSEYQSLDIKVPVTSVYIQPQSQVLVEKEEASFTCIVEESNPEASFRWIMVYQNGSSQEIHQKSTTTSEQLTVNVWQTNSTLKLNLTRDFQKIMCKSTVEHLPWTNSEYQELDVKVAVTSIHKEDAIFVCKVEESTGESSFVWTMVNKGGSSQEIHRKYTTKCEALNGKLWTLKLKITTDFPQIFCKATIENLHWTDSEYQPLDSMQFETAIISED